MSTIAEKLTLLANTKAEIKSAIIEKGQSVTDSDSFYSYAEKIRAISTTSSGSGEGDDDPSGSGSGGSGSGGESGGSGSDESVSIEELNVTENGTYTADAGKAYSPVNVNVDTNTINGTFDVDGIALEAIVKGDTVYAFGSPDEWVDSTKAVGFTPSHYKVAISKDESKVYNVEDIGNLKALMVWDTTTSPWTKSRVDLQIEDPQGMYIEAHDGDEMFVIYSPVGASMTGDRALILDMNTKSVIQKFNKTGMYYGTGYTIKDGWVLPNTDMILYKSYRFNISTGEVYSDAKISSLSSDFTRMTNRVTYWANPRLAYVFGIKQSASFMITVSFSENAANATLVSSKNIDFFPYRHIIDVGNKLYFLNGVDGGNHKIYTSNKDFTNVSEYEFSPVIDLSNYEWVTANPNKSNIMITGMDDDDNLSVNLTNPLILNLQTSQIDELHPLEGAGYTGNAYDISKKYAIFGFHLWINNSGYTVAKANNKITQTVENAELENPDDSTKKYVLGYSLGDVSMGQRGKFRMIFKDSI